MKKNKKQRDKTTLAFVKFKTKCSHESKYFVEGIFFNLDISLPYVYARV